jgi:hypothetical protein
VSVINEQPRIGVYRVILMLPGCPLTAAAHDVSCGRARCCAVKARGRLNPGADPACRDGPMLTLSCTRMFREATMPRSVRISLGLDGCAAHARAIGPLNLPGTD